MNLTTSNKNIFSKPLYTAINDIVVETLDYYSIRFPIMTQHIRSVVWEDLTEQLEDMREHDHRIDRIYVDIRTTGQQKMRMTVSYMQAHCLAESKIYYDVEVFY